MLENGCERTTQEGGVVTAVIIPHVTLTGARTWQANRMDGRGKASNYGIGRKATHARPRVYGAKSVKLGPAVKQTSEPTKFQALNSMCFVYFLLVISIQYMYLSGVEKKVDICSRILAWSAAKSANSHQKKPPPRV